MLLKSVKKARNNFIKKFFDMFILLFKMATHLVPIEKDGSHKSAILLAGNYNTFWFHQIAHKPPIPSSLQTK